MPLSGLQERNGIYTNEKQFLKENPACLMVYCKKVEKVMKNSQG